MTLVAQIVGMALTISALMAQNDRKALTAELAPTGRLRMAINFGNAVLAQRDPSGGVSRGVSADLAGELGRRLGLPVDCVTYH